MRAAAWSDRRKVGRLQATLIALLLAFGVPTPVPAAICVSFQPQLPRIRGAVVTSPEEGDVTALAGAVPKLTRGRFRREAISDEDGYFSFPDLPQGDYSLHVGVGGFLDASDDIEVRECSPRDRVLLVSMTLHIDGCSSISGVPWRAARGSQRKSRG